MEMAANCPPPPYNPTPQRQPIATVIEMPLSTPNAPSVAYYKYRGEKSHYDACFGMHVETAASLLATLMLIPGAVFVTYVYSLFAPHFHLPSEDKSQLWTLMALHSIACITTMMAQCSGKSMFYAPFMLYCWINIGVGFFIMMKMVGVGLAIMLLSAFCLRVTTRAYVYARSGKDRRSANRLPS